MKTVIYFLSFKEVSTDDYTNLSSFNEYGNIKYETETSVFTIIIKLLKVLTSTYPYLTLNKIEKSEKEKSIFIK